MQKLKICIGVLALCLLFSFNLRHALNDYGVSDPNNNLHPQVAAQTNSSGGNSNVNCDCGGISGGVSYGCLSWCSSQSGGTSGGGGSGGTSGGGGTTPCEDRVERGRDIFGTETFIIYVCDRENHPHPILPCRKEAPNKECRFVR